MELPSDKKEPRRRGGGTRAPDEKPAEEPPEEAEAKIIVRSTGTVTYVGKDIALSPLEIRPAGDAIFITGDFTRIRTGMRLG